MQNIKKLRREFIEAYKKNDFLKAVLIGERIKSVWTDAKHIELDENYVEDMFNLAVIYDHIERYEKAIVLYKKAIGVMERINKSSSLLSNLYTNAAIIMVKQEKSKEAFKYFEKAYYIIRDKGEKKELADILYNIAACYFDNKDYANAMHFYLESLGNRDDKNKDLDYADTLNNMAYIYEYQKEYPQAENCLLSALDIIKKVCGICSEEYMRNVYYLGNFYENLGNFVEAKNYYEKTTELIKNLSIDNNPQYADVLNKLAYTYTRLNNDNKALMLRMKALNILNESVGENHIYYSDALKYIGDIYYRKGEYLRSKEFYEKSMAIKENILGLNDSKTIKDKISIAKVHRALKEYDRAEEIIGELMKFVSKDSDVYMSVLLEAARLYVMQCNTKKMYELYNLLSKTNTDLCFEDILNDLRKYNDDIDTEQEEE